MLKAVCDVDVYVYPFLFGSVVCRWFFFCFRSLFEWYNPRLIQLIDNETKSNTYNK